VAPGAMLKKKLLVNLTKIEKLCFLIITFEPQYVQKWLTPFWTLVKRAKMLFIMTFLDTSFKS
jgi:hypothetical protein